MRSKGPFLIPAAVTLVGAIAPAASAQVASALIREDDTVPGDATRIVNSINSPDTNGIGGWAFEVNHNDGLGGAVLSSGVGSVDGVTAAGILFTEGTFGPYVQTSWEFDIGLSDAGEIGYGTSGSGGPDGGLESAWINASPFGIEGEMITSGPAAGQFWSFASGVELADNGVLFWSGGTRATFDGGTTARGLFDSLGNTLLYSGIPVPGLPAPPENGSSIDFDYTVSSQASNYILQVEMETTGTGIGSAANNAIVLTGQGLTLDGALVVEGSPVPASVGGEAGEEWDNFDYFGVNEFGEYMFTGDTINGPGGITTDEFVLVNGQIVLREGTGMASGFVVNGAMENGTMNENGDWAVIWDIDHPVDGNVEALIVNGNVVLRENEDVDWTGDGVADAGFVIGGTTGFSGIKSLRLSDRDPTTGNVKVYFTAEVSDNGAATLEAAMVIEVATPAGLAGDVAINVTDSPDPLLSIPGSISYNVAVRNNSPTAVTGVVVTTTLAGALTFNAGASGAIAMDTGGGVITASIGTMQPNEIVTYTVVADAAAPGSFSTTSTVSANEADGDTSNNSITNTTDGGASSDLAISIADAPDPVTDLAGAITYTVTVDNIGPSDATGVIADFLLDASTTFNAGLSDPIVMDMGGGMLSADLGSISALGSASFTVVADVSIQTLATASASVVGNESDPETANNSASEDTNIELFTNLEVTITDSPDPVLPSGGDIVYTVTTTNNGPSDATGVTTTVSLDPLTVFSTADAPAVHDGSANGGDVTAAIGNLANGASVIFTITANAPDTGRPGASAAVVGSGNETDDDPTNNSAGTSTLVIDNTNGFPTGVYSNIAAQANSDVPGIPGAKFGTGFDRPFISPDGLGYIISADTDLATTMDEVVLVGSTSDGSASPVVQEGVTALPEGDLVGTIDTELSINNTGQYAFATNTNGATSADDVIVKWNGSAFVTVAREGDFAPPTLAQYSDALTSPNIVADGSVWFIADTDVFADTDLFILKDDGATVVLQEGTTPVGFALWDNFDSGDLSVDATGANYLVEGDDDGPTADDKIVAFNNNVVIRENEVLPGSGFSEGADAFSPTDYVRVAPSGNWWARGGNNDDVDWVLRNGDVLAVTGDPIFAGAGENYASTFFLFAENTSGAYIIGGLTDAPDSSTDAVLVLNGERVVARENDPVDLDNNGLFDDNVAIRTFGNDDAIITDDGVIYVVCMLRAGDDSGSNTDVGDALIRINTGALVCNCNLNGDADVDVLDLLEFLSRWFAGDISSDYNNDGSFESDILDLLDFLSCWFVASAGPCE